MRAKVLPSVDMDATGKNIQRLRKEKNLSVADIQEFFGFDAPQAIYKWQKGQCLPSIENLLGLGILLEVRVEEIIVQRTVEQSALPQAETCGSPIFTLSFRRGRPTDICSLFNHRFNDKYVSKPVQYRQTGKNR